MPRHRRTRPTSVSRARAPRRRATPATHSRRRRRGSQADDPLRKALKDERTGAVIAWSQSAALQQAGRAYLAGAQAADTIALAAQAAAAVKVAGRHQVTLDSKTCRTKPPRGSRSRQHRPKRRWPRRAQRRSGPHQVDRRGAGSDGHDGAYLAGNAGALEAAKTAKTAAVTRNPALAAQLDWIK